MAKTKISEFSSTPANNTDIDSINIAEGCAPSGINDAIRELMAQLKDFQTGAQGDSFNGPVGTTTAAAGAFTTLSTTGNVTFGGTQRINGTTSSALTITSSSGATNGFKLYNDSSTDSAYVMNFYNGPLIFGQSNAESMRLTSTGLGIGTSSPLAELDVASANTVTDSIGNAFIRATDAQAANVGGKLTFGGLYNGSSYYAFGGVAGKKENSTSGNVAGYLQLLTTTSAGSLTERARIDSSGNLLVGTTSGSHKLVVSQSGSNAAADISTSNTSTTNVVQLYRPNNGTMINFNNGGSNVGSISVTTTTSYNTSSDYRLKNTISPMTGALAKVALLKPCTYKWNADGSNGQGFIAHELAEVCPDAVTGEKDAVDENGNPKYQGIDVSFLVATLTAAIQELNAKFEAYKASHP